MSYAGPVNRSRASTGAGSASSRSETGRRSSSSASASRTGRPASPRPHATHLDDGTDWQQVAIFGAGLALGIALGAGAALLAAPRSGAETRAALLAGAGRVRRTTARRGRDAWDDLGDEIRNTTRALRRRRAQRELEAESALED